MPRKIASRNKLPETIPAEDYLAIVWKHLTQELCDEVFQATRDRERQRKWTLHTLLRVWAGLLQSPLLSQTEAIQACAREHPLFPAVEASPESFFMRIQKLRPEFFRNAYLGFTTAIEKEFPANFQTTLGISEEVFGEIYAVDGSRLAKVGRTLKVARNTTKAIIPGSMEAVYDLRRGHLRDLWFDPDGARSELAMFDQVLASMKPGALLVNDRYYPKPVIWRKLEEKKIWMVSRYNATVKKRKAEVLKKIRTSRVAVDDWLVEMGGSQYGEKPVPLRWVRVRSSEIDITLITNVLDPKILSVEQLLSLYRERWSVERMYLHLKEVLALNRLFNAHPAAVGQQVYATAIIYNALRLSQAKIAARLKIPPERFSPDKLLPRLIERLVQRTWLSQGAWLNQEENQMKVSEEDQERLEQRLNRHPALQIDLSDVWVEKRAGPKRLRRFCKGRKTWTTYRKIPGAKKLLKN